MMRFKSTLAALTLMLAPIGFAHAVPVKLDFTATGFAAGAPQSVVSGSIVYDAVSVVSTIQSLISIDLTIAGQAYTLAEVGFTSPWNLNDSLIGGTACAVNCITHGTKDFWLIFNPVLGTGSSFAYSTPGGTFWHGGFSSLRVAQVPEPMTIGLMGWGLLAMWQFGRRRASKTAL